MKLLINAIICPGFLCAGAQAFAGDSTQSDTPSNAMTPNHQIMKDCMTRQAEKNDGMLRDDMKKACKDEMKTHKDHESMTNAPSATPTNAALTDAPTDPTTDKTIGTATSSNK